MKWTAIAISFFLVLLAACGDDHSTITNGIGDKGESVNIVRFKSYYYPDLWKPETTSDKRNALVTVIWVRVSNGGKDQIVLPSNNNAFFLRLVEGNQILGESKMSFGQPISPPSDQITYQDLVKRLSYGTYFVNPDDSAEIVIYVKTIENADIPPLIIGKTLLLHYEGDRSLDLSLDFESSLVVNPAIPSS